MAPIAQEAKMAERNNQRGNRRDREETPDVQDGSAFSCAASSVTASKWDNRGGGVSKRVWSDEERR